MQSFCPSVVWSVCLSILNAVCLLVVCIFCLHVFNDVCLSSPFVCLSAFRAVLCPSNFFLVITFVTMSSSLCFLIKFLLSCLNFLFVRTSRLHHFEQWILIIPVNRTLTWQKLQRKKTTISESMREKNSRLIFFKAKVIDYKCKTEVKARNSWGRCNWFGIIHHLWTIYLCC